MGNVLSGFFLWYVFNLFAAWLLLNPFIDGNMGFWQWTSVALGLIFIEFAFVYLTKMSNQRDE